MAFGEVLYKVCFTRASQESSRDFLCLPFTDEELRFREAVSELHGIGVRKGWNWYFLGKHYITLALIFNLDYVLLIFYK